MISAKARMRDFLFYKARPHGACLLWRGSSDRVLIGSKHYQVARLVYQTLCGRIPVGHDVRHYCLNDMCMNKAHLYVTRCNEMTPMTPAGQKHLINDSKDCQAL